MMRTIKLIDMVPVLVRGVGVACGSHPLVPGGGVDQGGFALLFCAIVTVEWAEELHWRVAHVPRTVEAMCKAKWPAQRRSTEAQQAAAATCDLEGATSSGGVHRVAKGPGP
jgi:hypothetical protein